LAAAAVVVAAPPDGCCCCCWPPDGLTDCETDGAGFDDVDDEMESWLALVALPTDGAAADAAVVAAADMLADDVTAAAVDDDVVDDAEGDAAADRVNAGTWLPLPPLELVLLLLLLLLVGVVCICKRTSLETFRLRISFSVCKCEMVSSNLMIFSFNSSTSLRTAFIKWDLTRSIACSILLSIAPWFVPDALSGSGSSP